MKKKIKIGILLDNYSISFFVKDIVIWLKQNSNKFDILDFPIACEASNTALIDKLLSPLTVIFLLKLLILLFITKKFFTQFI